MATSRVSATTKGAARILRTIISATSRKILLINASMVIVSLNKSGHKDVCGAIATSKNYGKSDVYKVAPSAKYGIMNIALGHGS